VVRSTSEIATIISKKEIGSAVMLPRAGGARVLAFPLSRRRNLVKKLAEQMLACSPKEAQRHFGFGIKQRKVARCAGPNRGRAPAMNRESSPNRRPAETFGFEGAG
jgi:hypothetical protein